MNANDEVTKSTATSTEENKAATEVSEPSTETFKDMLMDEDLQQIVKKYESERAKSSSAESNLESKTENVELSSLHLNMLMDKDLFRVVTKYELTRKLLADEITTKKEPKWLLKDTEWTKSKPGTSSESPKKSDYLLNLVKNNKPTNLTSLSSIEEQMTREAKAEFLKKQIQVNIKVANAQLERIKKAHKERTNAKEPKIQSNIAPTANEIAKKETVRSRTESQSSSNTSSSTKKRKNKAEKLVQKPLSINSSPLTKEEYLILSMLMLNTPIEREQYLIKIAKERNLLQKHSSNSNILVMNPKYGGILPTIREQAKQNIDQMAPCVLQVNGQQRLVSKNGEQTTSKARMIVKNGEKVMLNGAAKDSKSERESEDKKRKFKVDSIKKELSYQEQVMQIVNEVEELPEDPSLLKHNFKMPRFPVNDAKYQENVDSFVKKLVSENAGHLHKGEIRINAKNYGQAFVCDKEARDVFIGTPCLRRFALQGDVVEIYVHHGVEVEVPESPNDLNVSRSECEGGAANVEVEATAPTKPRKLGFVTRIIQKKHNRQCIGTFSETFSKETKMARFVPRDIKMPVIYIPKQNWPNALLLNDPKDVEKVVYLAEIIEFKGEKAIGNILKPLGKCGELEVENEAILVQNNLDITPFSEHIINQLPKSPFVIPEEEYAKREDLRKTTIFTIDPLTARDLDDALSCKKLENGNYEIGVHISDVTYFLKEGTELDDLVKEKATTIYMVDNVYHMLPKPLCFLCSLLPGEDKFAFSVFWEMKEDTTIVKTRFARTIINSCTQFAYEHAQKIIDLPDDSPLDEKDFPQIANGVSLKEIQGIIKVLQRFAVKLREKRMANGALKIDQPKLSFRLDPETGKPVSYSVYELKEANRMIEDWMFLANCSVAAFIFKYKPKHSILRNHSRPSDNAMDNLENTLKKFDYVLNGRTSTELRDTMEQIINASASPDGARTVMNVLLSKPMQRAKYFCSGTATQLEDFYHFALAVKMYTHFTSPIRRYADVMVHRTLAGILEYAPPSNRSTEELQNLANICNMQKYNAKNAGDESSDLYFRTYLNQVKSIKTRAAVISLGTYSLEVVLMQTGHTVKIFYKYLEPHTKVIAGQGEKITKVLMFWPTNADIKPRKITLFSELVVEVTTQKMKLAINRVFPED
ncbi:DIS3-like exonuclease 2 isoform X2 [Culicoides brevitarsis]|uniref:DIS3-like exonuclease 2 isoform X2 n=1 Tax=Culicoides brevitarsis TaxID=469753 RepID=UPI00307C12CA